MCRSLIGSVTIHTAGIRNLSVRRSFIPILCSTWARLIVSKGYRAGYQYTVIVCILNVVEFASLQNIMAMIILRSKKNIPFEVCSFARAVFHNLVSGFRLITNDTGSIADSAMVEGLDESLPIDEINN